MGGRERCGVVRAPSGVFTGAPEGLTSQAEAAGAASLPAGRAGRALWCQRWTGAGGAAGARLPLSSSRARPSPALPGGGGLRGPGAGGPHRHLPHYPRHALAEGKRPASWGRPATPPSSRGRPLPPSRAVGLAVSAELRWKGYKVRPGSELPPAPAPRAPRAGSRPSRGPPVSAVIPAPTPGPARRRPHPSQPQGLGPSRWAAWPLQLAALKPPRIPRTGILIPFVSSAESQL